MIDYSKSRELMVRRGHNYKSLSLAADIPYGKLRSVMYYNHSPMTDVIAKLCFVLNCTPSELMEFDFKFPKDNTLDTVINGTGELTYDPLKKYLIRNNYSGKGPKTTTELFDLLRRYYRRDMEEEERACRVMNKARGIDIDEVRKRGVKREQPEGLSTVLRIAIMHDRPVRMDVIYDICKELKCSPDCVLYYK